VLSEGQAPLKEMIRFDCVHITNKFQANIFHIYHVMYVKVFRKFPALDAHLVASPTAHCFFMSTS
jgi:hypothetical protein